MRIVSKKKTKNTKKEKIETEYYKIWTVRALDKLIFSVPHDSFVATLLKIFF